MTETSTKRRSILIVALLIVVLAVVINAGILIYGKGLNSAISQIPAPAPTSTPPATPTDTPFENLTIANSLSSYTSYTEITLTPWSYPPCSVKFGNTSYYIVFFLIGKSAEGMPSMGTPPDPFFQVTAEQTHIIYQNESFRAIQGAKYSFEGLQIAVDSVNVTSNPVINPCQLVLSVKSTISNSEPIIIFPTISPSPSPYEEGPVPIPTPPYIVR